MITTTRPTVSIQSLYSVQDTARMLGIHRNSLYNYERRNLIESQTSVLNGRQLFKGKEILRFWDWTQGKGKKKTTKAEGE